MPPAAIQVRNLNYEGIEIDLFSLPGFLYEGAVTMTYTINGKAGSFSVSVHPMHHFDGRPSVLASSVDPPELSRILLESYMIGIPANNGGSLTSIHLLDADSLYGVSRAHLRSS
jgi:hypothetical protein